MVRTVALLYPVRAFMRLFASLLGVSCVVCMVDACSSSSGSGATDGGTGGAGRYIHASDYDQSCSALSDCIGVSDGESLLVESRRGAHGGYTLSRPASEITMAEIVSALEGHLAPIECITPDGLCSREVKGDAPCPTKLLWTRVQGSIVRTLTDMTLADLAPPRQPSVSFLSTQKEPTPTA